MKLAIAGTLLSLLHLLPVVVVAQSQPLAASTDSVRNGTLTYQPRLFDGTSWFFIDLTTSPYTLHSEKSRSDRTCWSARQRAAHS